MDAERLQFLRESIRAKPADTFARYALALELTRSGESTEALEQFEYLMQNHPDYSPTYYQAGTLLASLDRAEEARKAFTKGLEVTHRLGQKHAESELRAALDELE